MAARRTPSQPPEDGTTPFGPVSDTPGAGLLRGYALDVIEGPASPQRVEMGLKRCTIGSAPSCDLSIDDPTVSRFHCEILVDGARVRVHDLGSRNGTSVDGTL